jgi:type IV secretion system protein TrbL
VNNLGVIDQFTATFSQYIDSGFGLLGNEVAYLTATLTVIDMTLAGLFWAMGGDEDVIAKLIKKTLYIGAFAFIITNFNSLSGILFRSFAGLGLTASGSTLTQAQFLQPGHLATVGVDAAHPILAAIGPLAGFPDVFSNLDTIVVLFIAWLIVIVSFFVLAVQLFVTLIEFKLTTLAGFVLVPFALWNKTAFLAERVLGNVVSSGIKVLVLAVIVGIGSGLFAQFTAAPAGDLTIDNALAIVLASLALLGLGLFGPSIATGLVAGAPQLGAGAAAGTLLGATGLGVAAAGTAAAGARLAAGGVRGGASAISRMSGGSRPFGGGGGSSSSSGGLSSKPSGASPKASASSGSNTSNAAATEVPSWAQRMQRRQRVSHGISTAAHVMRGTDHGGSGAQPDLKQTD